MGNQVVSNLSIDVQAGTTNTYYATWNYSHKKLKEFSVKWSYEVGNNVWFSDGESTVSKSVKNATYSPPDNAKTIKVAVKPVPEQIEKTVKDKKTGKKKKVKKPAFSAAWVTKSKTIDQSSVIEVPATPDITVVGMRMYMSVKEYHPTGNYTVDTIEYEIIGDQDIDNQGLILGYVRVPINLSPSYVYSEATGYFEMLPGFTYKARARAYITTGKSSEWSSFSEEVGTVPAKVPGTPAISTESGTSVRVTWEGVANVKNYEIQYVKDDPDYFDTNPDEVKSSRPSDENTRTERIITGLENTEGPTYFFRIRGFNDNTQYNDGNGAWSEIGHCTVGTKPNPPTTWSYTSTAKIGEDVILNWVHNSEDGSKQTAAEINITVGETILEPVTFDNDTSSYAFSTNGLTDNTEVRWSVKTKGAVEDFSDPSTVLSFKVFEAPTVSAALYGGVAWAWDTFNFDTNTIFDADGYGTDPIDTVTKYPFVLYALASPATQKAVSFAVSITSGSSYDTLDDTGVGKRVLAGDEIYQGYFVPEENDFSKTFRPYDIDLENGVTYTVTVSVAMDSGLDGELSFDFTVDWEEEEISPGVEIGVNFDTLSCYLRPYCYIGDDEDNITKNVWLSVYRREYDGSFTEIAKDIDGEFSATITDPHPALDYGRYRVVGVSKETGSVGYFDVTPEPILHEAIVIQWDEKWELFGDPDNVLDMENPPWAGSMLELPYNIDVSVDSKPDVALVEYIGRRSPVSYYGTQMGEHTQWTCEIPKSDKETLYQIRRLASYMGDVYVREPSGIGYWANVTVNYNLQHLKSTVPVTFSITRVEGGA